MAIGSGVSTQFGFKEETTFGTAVTPDRFLEIESEDIQDDIAVIDAPTLGDQFLSTTSVDTYVSGAQGTIVLPVKSKGFGKLFKQMLGSSTTTQVGATAEYNHEFTPDSNGGQGVSATVELVRTDSGGTQRVWTYEGGKVVEWEMTMAFGELLKVTPNWAFEDFTTGTTVTAASYAAGRKPFNWSKATLTVNAVSVFARSFSIRMVRAVDLERRGLSQAKRKEPILNGISTVEGTLDVEFESMAQYDAFKNGTQQSLVFTVTGDTIATTSNPYKVVVTCAAVQYRGGTPRVGGPEILRQQLQFRALKNASDPVVKINYHNDETVI